MKALGSKYNFLGLSKEHSDYKNSKIVILQAPFEKSSNSKGTSKAAKEILTASKKLEFYDEEQNRELCSEKGICSLETLNFEKSSAAKSLEKIYKETAKLLEDDKFIVTIGGEQKISLSTVKAHQEKYPELNVVHFSAHSFLEDVTKNCDSTMAQISEFNKNIIQVGVRSQSAEENRIRRTKGIRIFYTREIKMGMYGEHWQEIISKSAGESIFISFNADVFDPSFMQAVNNPEPGGLFWDETLNLLKIFGMDKNIVGFEIVGFAPFKNFSSSNYAAAKLIYKILNYAFIER
jgi:agmatinase